MQENVNIETMPNAVKVVIIEDKEQIRNGLAALISGTEGFQCTGTFESMESALTQINARNTDLVLVDIGLPGMSGIEGMRLFKKNFPNLLLLVLSVYEDDDRIFEALCAGASGYLLKKTSPARLLEGLREAVNGGAPMSPEVARRVITVFREIRPPENSDYQLTPHETRLLKLLVEGHNYKTAAAELGVSVNTISFHLKHIYEKLQVHSKSEAVAKALRNRLIK
jgi:DNA-binding NarL/FixJ family response regulator